MIRTYSPVIPSLGLVTRGVDVVTTPVLLRRQLINWSAGSRTLVDRLFKAVEGQSEVRISYRETTRSVSVLACEGPFRCGVQVVLLDHDVLLEVHGLDGRRLPVAWRQLMELRWRFQTIFSIG